MRIIKIIFFLSILLIRSSHAGDIADFITIGWCSDYSYYAFAQYGEQDGSGFPYAELYIADVEKNVFVPGGVIREIWEDEDDPEASGLNVLISLMDKSDSLRKVLGIDPRNLGKIVFQSSQAPTDTAKWIGPNGEKFEAVCSQRQLGSLQDFNVKAAFDLKIRVNGTVVRRVGDPHRMRPGVIRYAIDRVLADPENQAIVVVMSKEELGFEGPSVRYMVETFRLEH